MNRLTGVIAIGVVGMAAGTPAFAFQFENGTVWPLAVGINNGPTQVVPPEEVMFLFSGQCDAGCGVNILVADPSRPQTAITGPGGEPPVIGANGDRAILRVRQDRGGITVEVIADPAPLTPPTLPGGTASTLPQQTLPAQPQTLPAQPQQPLAPAPTPPAQTTAPAPEPQQPANTGSSSPGFIPPPPAPDYGGN